MVSKKRKGIGTGVRKIQSIDGGDCNTVTWEDKRYR
jgi:hypothetical protein